MKFLKPVLILLTILALTYTVSASNISFGAQSLAEANTANSTSLPLNGDLLFAFTAIASLGGYLAFKK